MIGDSILARRRPLRRPHVRGSRAARLAGRRRSRTEPLHRLRQPCARQDAPGRRRARGGLERCGGVPRQQLRRRRSEVRGRTGAHPRPARPAAHAAADRDGVPTRLRRGQRGRQSSWRGTRQRHRARLDDHLGDTRRAEQRSPASHRRRTAGPRRVGRRRTRTRSIGVGECLRSTFRDDSSIGGNTTIVLGRPSTGSGSSSATTTTTLRPSTSATTSTVASGGGASPSSTVSTPSTTAPTSTFAHDRRAHDRARHHGAHDDRDRRTGSAG